MVVTFVAQFARRSKGLTGGQGPGGLGVILEAVGMNWVVFRLWAKGAPFSPR